MRFALAAAGAAALTLVLASVASAHAIMSPPVAKSKVAQQFTLSVPTEEEGATTTEIELTVPAGFSIDSFEPSPGWKREESATGSGEERVIQQVTWSGGKVPTDEDAVFRFNGSTSSNKTYTFTVRQTYSNGKVVDWSGSESSDTPAPTIEAVSDLGGGSSSTLTIVALIVGGIVAYRWLSVAENRARAAAEMEKRPVLRNLLALGRRLSPQARFLLNRLTPGGLGLEFTTALAAVAVGSYVLIAYALVVGDSPGPTTGDSTAADFVEQIRTGWLTSLAKAITLLGSGAVVVFASAAVAVWLVVRRAWPELVVLVVGTVAILWGTDLIKEEVARPRPSGGLIDVAGFSYPSGHASHSIVYVWIAVTAAIRLRPGMRRGTALIVAAFLLAVLIGLSRVYLGVHYLSDVSGGWAFGVAVFALLSAIVVVVVHLRQNEIDVG